MNWNTKAKTRAGRGKSRENIECQQRLAAWNKLPKRRGTSMNHGTNSSDVPSRPRISQDVDHGANQHRADQLLSNDLMMLQGLQSRERPQQQHTPERVVRKFSSGDLSRKRKFEDPLGLLELTPEKDRRLIHESYGREPPLMEFDDYLDDDPQLIATLSAPTLLPITFFNDGRSCDGGTGLPLLQDLRQNRFQTDKISKDESRKWLSSVQSSLLRPIFTLIDAQHAVTDVSADNRVQHSTEVDLTDNRQTSTNWWPRFTTLISETITQNSQSMSFIHKHLDHFSLEGDGRTVEPKTALLTLYRALNQVGSDDWSPDGASGHAGALSAGEITALCDAIRFLESLDKQINVEHDLGSSGEYHQHDFRSSSPTLIQILQTGNLHSQPTQVADEETIEANNEWNLFDGSIFSVEGGLL